MHLLALETTSRSAGVALLEGERIIEETRLDEGSRHGVGLLPALRDLLQRHSIRPADISGIAVSLGPGSFTGIRIGIAAAQGFSIFARCALIGVPTLDVIAAEAPPGHARLVAAIDAGRGRVYGAIYVRPLRNAVREHGYDVCIGCGYRLRRLGDDVDRCHECAWEREPMPTRAESP